MPTGLDLLRESGAIIAALDSEEGMDAAECDARLSAWMSAQADKLAAYHAVCARLDAEDELMRAHAERIASRRRLLARHREHVRSLATALLLHRETLTGDHRCRGDGYSAWLQASESVEGPEAPEAWPEAYQRVRVEPDRAGALRALRAGLEVPGVRLVSTRSVRWR